jgi:hypothetical protein
MKARFAFIFAAVAGLYALPIFSLELQTSLGLLAGLVMLLALFVLLVLAVVMLVLLLRDHRARSERRSMTIALVLFGMWFPSCATGALGPLGDFAFFARRSFGLRDLARTLENDGRILQMSNGQLFWKTLNGISYRREGDDDPVEDAVPLQKALATTGISQEAYEDLQRQLSELDVLVFWVTPEQTIFSMGGLLEHRFGILHVQEGKEIRTGASTPEGTIQSLTWVAPGWYVYRT